MIQRILGFVILCLIGTIARAQLPQTGWKQAEVERFMKGKYQYFFADAAYSEEDGRTEIFRYAPVTLYGIEGKLSVMFNRDSTVASVEWLRGQSQVAEPKEWIPRKDRTLVESKIPASAAAYFADEISKLRGKPAVRNEKNDELEYGVIAKKYTRYSWQNGDELAQLNITPDSSVSYFYAKIRMENAK
ncbi:MAG: hypothetical protein Q8916_15090 [Bacteroidota bacterium]|nr:hypothetical protein [Bacteroidota bacterium]MDP4236598.1 hypothetical protein [Bacteroidota bacterium]